MAVSDWSTVAASNTAIDGTNIGEGCAPAGLNNALRSVMAAVRTFYNSALRVGGNVTIQLEGGSLPATPAENDIFIEYEA